MKKLTPTQHALLAYAATVKSISVFSRGGKKTLEELPASVREARPTPQTVRALNEAGLLAYSAPRWWHAEYTITDAGRAAL